MKIKTTFLKIMLAGMSGFILFLGLVLSFGVLHSDFIHDLYIEKILTYFSLYGSAIVALMIIVFIYRILRLIDQNNPFSDQSLHFIRLIKKSTLAMFVLFLGLLPMFYKIADGADAPGMMIIGLGIVAVPLVVVVFIATIEKLLESVIQIKLENDLTV